MNGVELRLTSLGRGRASMVVLVVGIVVWLLVRLFSSEISAGKDARQM